MNAHARDKIEKGVSKDGERELGERVRVCDRRRARAVRHDGSERSGRKPRGLEDRRRRRNVRSAWSLW